MVNPFITHTPTGTGTCTCNARLVSKAFALNDLGICLAWLMVSTATKKPTSTFFCGKRINNKQIEEEREGRGKGLCGVVAGEEEEEKGGVSDLGKKLGWLEVFGYSFIVLVLTCL